MRFHSPDGSSFILLTRHERGGYAYFDVRASFEGFSGRNKDVIFSDCTGFLNQLHEFDAKREGTVKLDGTENCRLSISSFDSAGHLRVDIRLCRYKHDHPFDKTTVLTLEGGFPIDMEYANQIFRELHELLRE